MRTPIVDSVGSLLLDYACMKFEDPIPDAAQKTLARLGRTIEYTDRYPGGIADLAKSEVSNDDLRHLSFCPGLSALDLDNTSVSDAGMPHVGGMGTLEYIRLSNALVSDDGLEHLYGLPKLERLDIGSCPGCHWPGQRPVSPAKVRRNQITNRALGFLAELLALRSLGLQATQVNDAGLLRYMEDLSQLQSLSLAYLDVTDKGIRALEGLAWLERLNLRHTGVSSTGIVELVNDKAHTLRHLNLSNTVVKDGTLTCFPDRAQLLELVLMDTAITDAGCQDIARCEWLTNLRLGLTDVTDDGIRDLADCQHLRSLDLFRTKISDTSLVWLSDLKLEHLGLGRTAVTDVGLPELAEYPDLKYLDLRGTALTDRGLHFLSEAPLLELLYLDHTDISAAGLTSLLPLPLITLSLNAAIGDYGLQTIAGHEALRRLAIWKAGVTNWGPLARLNRLRTLLIDDAVNDLTPLYHLQELQYLLLWGDNFSATEVARLRLALPRCRIKSYESCDSADEEFRRSCQAS